MAVEIGIGIFLGGALLFGAYAVYTVMFFKRLP